jgi:arabinogalactan oligomer/maltooligosaccharide transport system permease protein
MIGRSRREVALIHATLIFACLAAVGPVLWVVITSLKPAADIFRTDAGLLPAEPTLAAYREVLSHGQGAGGIALFWRWFLNSAMAAGATAIVGTLLAGGAAHALSRYRFRGQGMLGYLLLLAQMLPGAVLLVPLYLMLHRSGLLGTLPGLVTTYLTVCLPFSVWMLKASFDAVPRGLDEAAMVDGLSPWGIFLRIVLPLSWPGVAVTAFFGFLTAWNEYLFASAFMTGEANALLPVGMAAAFGDQYQTKWHLLSAGSVLVTIPVLAVFITAQRGIIAGLSQGGVKG